MTKVDPKDSYLGISIHEVDRLHGFQCAPRKIHHNPFPGNRIPGNVGTLTTMALWLLGQIEKQRAQAAAKLTPL